MIKILNTVFNTKLKEIKDRISDINGLVTDTALNIKTKRNSKTW